MCLEYFPGTMMPLGQLKTMKYEGKTPLMQYNEYVIHNPEQICIRYIVMFDGWACLGVAVECSPPLGWSQDSWHTYGPALHSLYIDLNVQFSIVVVECWRIRCV